MNADPLRALIVEDSVSWQDILAEILSDVGLEVDVASDMESAIALLRARPHRLAVVDLALADDARNNRDGLKVLEAARRFDPGCVTVLLTGFATVELAVGALTEHGAYTCLRKEAFRRSEFRDVIHRALALAPSPATAGASPDVAPRPAVPAPRPVVAGASALLVEDDAGWRAIVSELLADAGMSVRLAASYAEALGYLKRERVNVAVVDLSLASSEAPLGNRDGYEVLRAAQETGVPAVVVSGLATREDVERAYAEFGVFAHVEKQGFDRLAFTRLAMEACEAGQSERGEVARLTPRERDVLALVAQGLTNKGVAHALVISENTVKRYLKSIFEKLDVDSRAAATAIAVTAGLQGSRSR